MGKEPRRLRLSDYVWAGLFFACAGLCFITARIGEGQWWMAVAFGLGGVSILLAPGFKPYVDEIHITDDGITRRFGPKFRARKEEKISWAELTKVEILTTDDGPYAEDFFFLLRRADGSWLAVSNSLAVEHELLDKLQKRLPGLDNLAVATASGSTENRLFTIWQRSETA